MSRKTRSTMVLSLLWAVPALAVPGNWEIHPTFCATDVRTNTIHAASEAQGPGADEVKYFCLATVTTPSGALDAIYLVRENNLRSVYLAISHEERIEGQTKTAKWSWPDTGSQRRAGVLYATLETAYVTHRQTAKGWEPTRAEGAGVDLATHFVPAASLAGVVPQN